jgi:uncharacterized protein (TIRG00374 family)
MANILKKKQFWGGLIALAILFYLFYDLDLTRTLQLCRTLDIRFILPVLICTTLLVVFKAWRWKVIVSRTRKIFFWPTLSLYATSQLIGVLLPALTGQAGRIILFSRKGNFSKTYAFSTVFLEVVFDAAGLLFLMVLSSSVFVFPHQYRFISYIIGGATFLMLTLFYASLHYQQRLEDYGYKKIRPRSPKAFLVIRKFLRSFNDGISIMKHTDKMFMLSILTILSWASHIAAIYFLFFLFKFNLPVWAAVVVIIVNYLALMIPITPGNVGSFQLAVVASLNIFSIHKTEAVLFSVMLYVADMIPMVIMSAFFLFREHFAISDISGDKELIAEVEQMVVEQDMPTEKETP